MKTVMVFGVERTVAELGDRICFPLDDGFIEIYYASEGNTEVEIYKVADFNTRLTIQPEVSNVIRVS